MWGMLLRTDCARQILITEVDPGSPAEGLLEVGDVILGVGGRRFDSDARIAFGKAITEAEKAENKGKLELIRWRDGKIETVALQLKVMGTYGPLAPVDCPKSRLILDNACEYVADNGIGKGIPGYVNALGLRASGDRETILGGIYGLEYQGRKAEPAVDKLVKLLAHDDIWIRFRAGAAPCAIGKPAREKAVPVLLKMALKTSEDDPREMHQRSVSFVLWGGGVNGAPHGLIARDMTGVDHDLLVPALRKLLKNTDGHTRSFVGRAIKLMTPEELAPLWPDIVWAVNNPSPSGIMFNAVIREAGFEILVQNRFKEAIPLCAQYARKA